MARNASSAPKPGAGYSGTPLPKKLGIKAGRVVKLMGAPRDFAGTTLGPLPDGARVARGAATPFDVGVLFVRTKADLAARFPAATRAMSERCAFWIAWPKKASGVASDLDENVVRAIGLAAGLVDYKVAALDETWSGLCFARRRG